MKRKTLNRIGGILAISALSMFIVAVLDTAWRVPADPSGDGVIDYNFSTGTRRIREGGHEYLQGDSGTPVHAADCPAIHGKDI